MRRIIAGLIAGLVLLAACSGAGPPIDEYAPVLQDRAGVFADEVEALAEQNASELNSAINRLQNDLQGEALVDAALGETATRSSMLFAGIGDALDRYVRDLDAMAVPDAVADEHASFIAAYEASRSGVAPLMEALAAATTFEQIDAAIASSGFSDAQPRVAVACTTLEGAIATLGAAANLRCEVVR